MTCKDLWVINSVMPYRKTPLVTDEVYHVYNRSIGGYPIFLQNSHYQRGLDLANFYRFDKPPLRFSHYNRLPDSQKNEFMEKLKLSPKRIKIFTYCLMPNHVHFLLKQLIENGIANFMSNIQESYAKYFNIKEERTGSLFQSMFKAVRIETDEQLIHVTRYIHLNPLTSYVIKNMDELETYPWCSFAEYMGQVNHGIVDKEEILQYFGSVNHLRDFTMNQVDYQRKLAQIKHLAIE